MTMPIQPPLPQPVGAIEEARAAMAQAANAQNPVSFVSALQAAMAAVDQAVSGTATQGAEATAAPAAAGAPSPPASALAASDPFAGLVPVAGAASAVSTGSASERAAAVTAATSQIGVPYVWGGASPQTGFDCSGLVQWAYAQAGVSLPRTAAEQETVGAEVPSLAEAQPGDLVFYGSPAYHVAIYAGNGMVIQAPTAGERVELAPVGTPTEIRDPTAAPAASASAATDTPASLAATFQAASAAYNLPAGMLEAVARVESNFDPTAVSSAGAEGIMQLMPQTAASLGVNPFDPNQAIWGAAQLLASKLAHFGSVPLALAAYNAGDGAVEAYGGIPPYAQTQAYVAKVMGLMGGGSGAGPVVAA